MDFLKDLAKDINDKKYSVCFLFTALIFCLLLLVEKVREFFELQNYKSEIKWAIGLLLFSLCFYFVSFLEKKQKNRKTIKNLKYLIKNLNDNEKLLINKMKNNNNQLLLCFEMPEVYSLVNKKIIKQQSQMWQSMNYNNKIVQGYYFTLSDWVLKIKD